ncbi:hypothetical protein Tco_1196092 [Tanacetum coccineum]
MANREDLDMNDYFSDLYKEYIGPPRTIITALPNATKTNKRSHAGSDEEEELETRMLFLLILPAGKLRSGRQNRKLLKGFGRREKKKN